MDRKNVAVIGCGNAGRNRHRPVIEANPRLDLVAACDLDASRVDAFVGERDVASYTDHERLLDEVDLDAVHLCTPPQTHLPIGRDVLEADVPLLIEKPAATSTEEVDGLIEVRDRTGTPVSVVHNRLFVPHMRGARRRVESGEIGDVVAVAMVFANEDDLSDSPRGDWVFDLPGGELGEGSPHQIYTPLAFVDGLGDIEGVGTQNYRSYDDPVDIDGASIVATDESGARLVTVEMLANSATRDTLYVHGTEGELTVDFVRRGVSINRNKERYSIGAFLRGNVGSAVDAVANVVETGIGFARRAVYDRLGDPRSHSSNGHYVQVDRFVDAIADDGAVPVTLEEARETIAVLEALERE